MIWVGTFQNFWKHKYTKNISLQDNNKLKPEEMGNERFK